jgi:hypothetical protein
VNGAAVAKLREQLDNPRWYWLFGALLECRLLYPLFDSPTNHLFSDPQRHWENAVRFFDPTIMGSDDPYLYQLWLHCLQQLAGTSIPALLLGCGALCAALPYGWYRAMRELLPRGAALAAAMLIGITPSLLSIYAYFMNETLLLTLTGFAFWLTFRAHRKGTLGSFAAAGLVWIAAAFTRSAAVPIALIGLGWLVLDGSQRMIKVLVVVGFSLTLALPAGLHARMKLGYFAPLGNIYLHEIYRASGAQRMELEFGSDGRYWFVSPSFVHPTFHPLSNWISSSRRGTLNVTIDLRRAREDWISELDRVASHATLSKLRDTWENVLFLAFGESWPNDDRGSFLGRASIWERWIWVPVIFFVAYGVVRRRLHGPEWLLPMSGLIVFLWLGLQQQGITEGRFRLPLEPIFIASGAILLCRRSLHVQDRPQTGALWGR